MSIDLFGPDGVPRAATTRPVEPTSQPVDSWFADCANGAPGTGTPISARFLNRILAQFRSLVRYCGLAESHADSIVSRAIQSGRLNFGVDTGTADALVVSLPVAPAALVGGLPLLIRKINSANATGSPTLNVNGFGAIALKRRDGASLAAGDLPASCLFSVAYEASGGGSFRLIALVPSELSSGGGGGGGSGFLTGMKATRYTSSGSWTKDSTCVLAIIRATGGGGGGGGSIGGQARGGGGAGATSERRLGVSALAGVTGSVAVTIGAGGAAGNGASTSTVNGGSGGTTSVGGLCSAPGGGGTQNQNLGGGYYNYAAAPGAGGDGTGATGDVAFSGGDGQIGAAHSPYVLVAGGGGSSFYGGGGASELLVNAGGHGGWGRAYGAGAGGGAVVPGSTCSGGQGAGGFVEIIEFLG